MRSFVVILFGMSLVAFNTKAADFDDLVASPTYYSAKISPDGSKIAIGVNVEGQQGLLTLDANTFKALGGLNPTSRFEVGDFFWANNERIVMKMMQNHGWKEFPSYYGELYAMDYTGKNGELIYGFRAGEMQTGSRMKKREAIRSWAQIIDILPENNTQILISSEPMSRKGDRLAKIELLNVYTGIRKKVAMSPIPSAHFLTTQQGKIGLAVGVDKNFKNKAYYRDLKKRAWLPLSENVVDESFEPLSFNPGGSSLYFLGTAGQDKIGYHKLILATGEVKPLFVDPDVDITSVELSADGRLSYALRVDPDYPSYVMVNSKADESKVFKRLLSTFPEHKINITSRTTDGSKFIVFISSPTNPGAFYLYHADPEKLVFLFKKYKQLDTKKLVNVKAIQLAARDGLMLHGYLTDPAPNAKKSLPLVVLVHGGPHGPRDYWSYDREVQVLARQGYRVLQVNFRGSGGYGVEFETKGYRQWGSAIQHDIIDATKWAIEQGIADKDNICIMGASFGGYSAALSASIEPSLYQCVVAVAGVYDLPMMFDEGDIPRQYYGKAYLTKVLGTDKNNLKAASPTHNIAKLKAPIFIVHGDEDERAPIEQAEALRDALKQHNKQFEWYIFDKAGHGFYSEKTREKYYNKITSFLGKHLH